MIIAPESLLTRETFSNPDAIGDAWAEASRRLRDALADPEILDVGLLVGLPGAGKSTWCAENDDPRIVLFDAVSSEPGRRRAMASKIRRARKNPVAVWLKTPLSVAMRRNAQRLPWRRVPESAILRAAQRLRQTPPTRAEGWARVISVV